MTPSFTGLGLTGLTCVKHQFSAVGCEFSLEVGGGLETRETAITDEARG